MSYVAEQFEFIGVSVLMRHWAKADAVQGRMEKLEALREAVLSGVGRGKPWAWPRELLAADYQVVYEMVQAFCSQKRHDNSIPAIERSVQDVWIPLPRGPERPVTIERLLPVPTAKLFPIAKMISTHSKTPSEIARWIVAARFDINGTTVRTAVRLHEDEPRMTISPMQALLVSYLVDLYAVPDETDWHLRAMVLDSLLASGFKSLAIYHFCTSVRAGSRKLTSGGRLDVKAIKKTCRLAKKGRAKYHVFAQIVEASRSHGTG